MSQPPKAQFQVDFDAAAGAVAYDVDTAAKAAELASGAAERAETAPRRAKEQAQAESIERARLQLAGEEGSWLGRLSPRRNLWPELVELDATIFKFDTEQAAAVADVQALEQELREAEESDRAALARWHVGEGTGERPEPSAPRVAERLSQRRADADALPAAAAEAVTAKVQFVNRNRKRLVERADKHVEELAERYNGLIAALEECREDLLAGRTTALWTRLYPSASATQEPPHSMVLGLSKPAVEAFGHPNRVEPGALWRFLRADAKLVPTAIGDQQKQELEGPDPQRSAIWAESPEGQERAQAERREALERFKQETGHYPA
jgi:hypothetical protein